MVEKSARKASGRFRRLLYESQFDFFKAYTKSKNFQLVLTDESEEQTVRTTSVRYPANNP